VSQAALASRSEDEGATDERPAIELIELFFFAYRDFVSDPDRILSDYGFGRAHHRVLHFVARRPGLTIADLLEVLRITKQSLNRVLKELVDKGFVEQRTGTSDRRQRLLYPTPIGRDLALRLAQIQTRRIARALAGDRAQGLEEAAARFLLAMIDPEDQARVHGLIREGRMP
jgi:DNA-binding MarR family transcriptional regulator